MKVVELHLAFTTISVLVRKLLLQALEITTIVNRRGQLIASNDVFFPANKFETFPNVSDWILYEN